MAAAAPTHFNSPYGSLDLRRYPQRRQEPLQAWCAADSLLLDAFYEHDILATDTLVANDDHGALTAALAPRALWTDSALAAIATAQNLQRNNLAVVPRLWSTQSPGEQLQLALLRVPKQLPYFEHQVAVLAQVMAPGSLLICGGMDKHLSPHTASLIEKYFGPVTRHRGKHKARLFSAMRSDLPARGVPAAARYHCEELGVELRSLPNVFSRDRLDMGTRFLLQQLSRLAPVETVLDLACGNGVLGLGALQCGLGQQLIGCDESAMAIASARCNAQALFGESAAVNFHHGDGLLGLSEKVELILCNPPFHLGHTVDDFAGRRLLEQCSEQLLPGGKLCLVANRHLHYGATLKRGFPEVEQLAQNSKFTIWLARHG